MLTSMTIALARSQVPAFNRLFYATCATIIPVFFLALAMQTPMFVRVFRAYQGLARAARRDQRTRWQAYYGIAFTMAAILQVTLGAGVIAAGWGEVLAVYALHQEQGQAVTQKIVLGSVILLIVGATGLPVLNYLGGLSRTSAEPDRSHAGNGPDMPEQERTGP
jgi:hypothetical protein